MEASLTSVVDELSQLRDQLEKEGAKRERAEAALLESERESRLIVDRIPGLVATLTPAGEVEDVNNQVLEYCGRTLEELKQWGTSDTVHPEDLPRVIAVITQAMASADTHEIEERIRRFDGVYRWFQVRGLPCAIRTAVSSAGTFCSPTSTHGSGPRPSSPARNDCSRWWPRAAHSPTCSLRCAPL